MALYIFQIDVFAPICLLKSKQTSPLKLFFNTLSATRFLWNFLKTNKSYSKRWLHLRALLFGHTKVIPIEVGKLWSDSFRCYFPIKGNKNKSPITVFLACFFPASHMYFKFIRPRSLCQPTHPGPNTMAWTSFLFFPLLNPSKEILG